uniref:Uncharacterized protein n=1 Tax=Nelumbo nucifera TaxID=4432 RepID=A0A822XYV2_NELNU|nr:TPA_asm: hypothetical protein HUJ06_025629 [Nelumbo nucifera]
MFKLMYARSTEALMGRLFILNERVGSWVRSTEPEHWANSKFPRMRYDQMSFNIAETFNGWVLDIRDQPIMTMLNTFRLKLMELLWRRHCESQDCTTPVGKRIEEKLHVTIHNSIQFQVVCASVHEFEVTKGGKAVYRPVGPTDVPVQGVANEWPPMCTCMCGHIVHEWNVYEFVDLYYTIEKHRVIYSQPIHPMLPDELHPTAMSSTASADIDSSSSTTLRPPKTKQPLGRLWTKRIESQPIKKREVHCGWCGNTGDYRSTCKAPIE